MQFIRQYGEVVPCVRKKRRSDSVKRDNSVTIQNRTTERVEAVHMLLPKSKYDQHFSGAGKRLSRMKKLRNRQEGIVRDASGRTGKAAQEGVTIQ